MDHKSEFHRQLSFTSERVELIQKKSKRTSLIEEEGKFYRTLSFQSRWITEEEEA